MRAIKRQVQLCIFLVCLVQVALAAGCIDKLLGQIAQEFRGGTAAQSDVDAINRFGQALDPASDAGKGFVSSVSSRQAQKDGVSTASQILGNFPSTEFAKTPSQIFSDLEPFAQKTNFSDLVKQIGGTARNQRVGGMATLDYAKNVVGADSVAQFELELDGVVPDILDTAGNLHEVKYRDYSNLPPPFIQSDLDAIHTQAQKAFGQLGSGNTLTVAFKLPLSSDNLALFNQTFQDLLASPNFKLINGF